ncbi:hypothetical protein F8M41_003039 [Gigaspora margarita]|uniref:Uncharacterized protein n=1 Tax=Gigaspora margarita TaxID=4874 RepID=A0A8H4AYD2_GIGMA|nr:hypothetical protein F8M41_003039 [Gigaspora margarita]
MFAYWALGSSKNIDDSDIYDKDIDSDISESESAEGSSCFLGSKEYSSDEDDLDFDIINQSNKKQQHGKKLVNSKSWSNENECKEIDIQVEYNSWDLYLKCVVYILKDCKFENCLLF